MKSKKNLTMQDILKRRQQEEFVGRFEQLTIFRQSLLLELDDDRRRFIFNIFGQGGVGKSSLLRRFRQISLETDFISAWTDETKTSIPSVMNYIVEQFERQEQAFKNFNERYRVYRQRRHEIETDPEAPHGFLAFAGSAVAKTGVHLGRRIPIGGAIFDCVNEEAFATQVGEWTNYIARKLTNKDEVQLIQEPNEVLTPHFLEGLEKLSENHPIALFFDTYELTSEYLDKWLRNLLEGHYGDVPSNLIIAIAGRDELDKNLWNPYEGLLARLSLEPFSYKEADEYLVRRGIIDKRIIEVIKHLSGCLPLLVATLAAESPDDPSQVGDPSGTAIERFLKWEEEPERRLLALNAALPRQLNRDIVAELAGEEHANILFNWLKQKPFIEQRGKSWTYHNVVRTQMLHYKHHESPHTWSSLHNQLASYYDRAIDELGLDEEKKQYDRRWHELSLEVLYHRLCQAPNKHLHTTLNSFLDTFEKRRSFARDWAETIYQAGEDTEDKKLTRWGKRLIEGIKAYSDKNYVKTIEMFSALLDNDDIEMPGRITALSQRGQLYWLTDEYQRAIADLTETIQFAPKAQALLLRGQAYEALNNYDEALADFNYAVELSTNNSQEIAHRIAHRAETYQRLGHYEESLAEFDHAITLDEKDSWAIAQRGITYRLMKRYDEALADFSRAIALDEKDWKIAQRGMTYRLMKRYDEALADFNRAIALDEKNSWAIAHRGETYRLMKRYDEALADFSRAIALDEKNSWAIAHRGETYRQMGRYDEALADLNHALAIDEKHGCAYTHRGDTYHSMGFYDEALADYSREIFLNEKDDSAFAHRGETYRQLGRYDEALADFSRAIALDEKNSWTIAHRGETYRQMGRYDEALADLNHALAINEKHGCAYTHRGDTYRSMGLYDEALADYNCAIDLDTKDKKVIAERGKIYKIQGRYDEALADFDRAIELDPNNAQAIAKRGEIYSETGYYQEALKDFKQAIAIDANMINNLYTSLGLTYSYLELYSNAIECYEYGLRENPDDFVSLYNIAIALISWKGPLDSQKETAKAQTILLTLLDTDNHEAATYGLGGLAAALGNYDQALSYLRETILHEEKVIHWAQHDMAWKNLRTNTDFQVLVPNMNKIKA